MKRIRQQLAKLRQAIRTREEQLRDEKETATFNRKKAAPSNSHRPIDYLTHLPREMLEHILENLPLREVLPLLLSCRHMLSLCTSDALSVWRLIDEFTAINSLWSVEKYPIRFREVILGLEERLRQHCARLQWLRGELDVDQYRLAFVDFLSHYTLLLWLMLCFQSATALGDTPLESLYTLRQVFYRTKEGLEPLHRVSFVRVLPRVGDTSTYDDRYEDLMHSLSQAKKSQLRKDLNDAPLCPTSRIAIMLCFWTRRKIDTLLKKEPLDGSELVRDVVVRNSFDEYRHMLGSADTEIDQLTDDMWVLPVGYDDPSFVRHLGACLRGDERIVAALKLYFLSPPCNSRGDVFPPLSPYNI